MKKKTATILSYMKSVITFSIEGRNMRIFFAGFPGDSVRYTYPLSPGPGKVDSNHKNGKTVLLLYILNTSVYYPPVKVSSHR